MISFIKYTDDFKCDGVKTCYLHESESLAVVEIVDIYAHKEDNMEAIKTELGKDMLIAVSKLFDSVYVYLLNSKKDIRALEFLDYVFDDFGIVKGNKGVSSGKMSLILLQAKLSELDMDAMLDFFLYRVDNYFKECDSIVSKTYVEEYNIDLKNMHLYHKKDIPWAYVKTTDVAPVGSKIRIKTLENDSGVIVESSDQVYIMIGCHGEVYDIQKSKFQSSYIDADKVLDVFEQMLDFIPAVEIMPDEEYVAIDELAHLCYPQKVYGIYAKELVKRIRVYSSEDVSEYFVGKPGDFLAIREDDTSDVYIIQHDILKNTYE